MHFKRNSKWFTDFFFFFVAKSLLHLKTLSVWSQTLSLSFLCSLTTHTRGLPRREAVISELNPPPILQFHCFLLILQVVFFLDPIFQMGKVVINSFQIADLPVSDTQPYNSHIIYQQALNHIDSSCCRRVLSWRNKQLIFKTSNE